MTTDRWGIGRRKASTTHAARTMSETTPNGAINGLNRLCKRLRIFIAEVLFAATACKHEQRVLRYRQKPRPFLLLLLPQNPSKALCYVLSARNLSLGEVSDLAFRQTSYHSPHVRNKFRIRGRPFDREWNSSFPAGCSRNLRQTTHHAPVQISEHLES